MHSLLSSQGGDSCSESSQGGDSSSENRNNRDAYYDAQSSQSPCSPQNKSFRVEQKEKFKAQVKEEDDLPTTFCEKKKKKRRAPTTKLSFNSQVTVVSYNKYN